MENNTGRERDRRRCSGGSVTAAGVGSMETGGVIATRTILGVEMGVG